MTKRVTDYYLIEGKKYRKISDEKARDMLNGRKNKNAISIVHGEAGIGNKSGVCWIINWFIEGDWNEDRLFQSEVDIIYKLTHNKEVQDKILVELI